MNQDEIIEMARQAGLIAPSAVLQEGRTHDRAIEAFAKLVENAAFKRWASQTKLAVQDEREACLNIACDYTQKFADHTYTSDIAGAIRARGEA
jgi:hypothetical protein